MSAFATAIIRWQKKHGRHDLPWQQQDDPYKIWLSEIMLQQTQVATVIPYYHRFIKRFPTLDALARARLDSVLNLWSGLGYYARARHLHQAAKIMMKHGIPTDIDGWNALPGVGKSTAAAVCVFAYNQRQAILDGNVKRVLARTHLIAQPINHPAAHKPLWRLAEQLLPSVNNIRPYTQGLMDLGATRCKQRHPLCDDCPLTTHCLAYQQKLTQQYPLPAAKKTKPQKAARLVLLYHGDNILLQQQAAPGIWGGLWSLPLYENGKAHWQKTINSTLKKMPTLHFKHEFTHYRLEATVSVYHCQTAPVAALPAPLRWHRKLQNVALPAPIHKLLTRHKKIVE